MEAREPVIGDAFGQLLLDTWEAGGPQADTVEVIERAGGFIGTGRAGRYFASAAEWPPIELQLLARAGKRVLDIGCGAGRHALELQARGHDVVGLDTSPGAIEVCKLRSLRETFCGTVDLYAANAPGRFDAFVMLGNNLGLFASRAGAGAMLDSLAMLASPGALLLGTTIDPYETEEPAHRAYHEWNRSTGRMGGQVKMRVRYRDRASDWFDYLLCSEAELAALVEASGWEVSEVLRDGPRIGVVLQLR
jgi:SAM-dependent methyltransferase